MLTRFRSYLARTIAPHPVRRFDGAAGGRRGSGMGTFHRINPEIAAAASTVRSRARYLTANNPWINNGIANWVSNLVGAGIVPTSKHPDATTRKGVGAVFETWSEDADADGRTDFWGLQADIARGLVLDGEAFVHLMQTDDGLRLRLVPPELVDENTTIDLANGGSVIQGVEFDADGLRVAYHILPSRPTDQFSNYAPPIRVPATEIAHVFKPLAAGQVRGISWLAPIILPASEFDQLIDALLMGCKIAALHAGFLIDQNGNSGLAYDGTQTGGILETGIEPGTLKILPSGMDVKFNSPQQASETASFIRTNLQGLAAGLGLPEHLLSGDLTNANYSSLRAGLLPFRQRVEQTQYGVLVPQLLRPVWRRVLTTAVYTGELNAADFEENQRSYFAVEFIMPKALQVDPAKDVQATVAEMDAGLTSRRKAVAERGWNLEDLDAEIAADPRNQKTKEKPDAGNDDTP